MDVSNRKSETAMNKNAMEREARRRLTREKIFDDMMECIAEETLDEFAENLPPLDAPKPFETSDEYKKNIEMLIKGERKKEKHKIYMRRFVKVAAGMVICCGVLTATVLNVSAFRNPLFNFIVEHKEKYNEVKFEQVGASEEEPVAKDAELLNEFLGLALPKYIPDGYEYDKTVGSNGNYTTFYRNKDGMIIIIDQKDKIGDLFTDNENVTTKIKTVGKIKYYISNRDEFISICWEAKGKSFYLSGDCQDKNEMLKIAQGIKGTE